MSSGGDRTHNQSRLQSHYVPLRHLLLLIHYYLILLIQNVESAFHNQLKDQVEGNKTVLLVKKLKILECLSSLQRPTDCKAAAKWTMLL